MNEDEVLEKISEYYKGYCKANEVEKDDGILEELIDIALLRISEMHEGGYDSESAIEEYIDNEILHDVKNLEKGRC